MFYVARGTQTTIEGSENVVVKTENGMFYVATKEGKQLSPRCYKEISEFVNGLAVVTLKKSSKVHKFCIDGEVKREIEIYPKGVIDVNGVEIVKPIYDKVHISSNSIRICLDEKWGYTSLKGHMVCKPSKDFIEKFEDGCARVRNGDKWGVISYSNKYLIPENYVYLGELRYGKRVAVKTKLYGVIDNKGNAVEPFIYDEMQLVEKTREVILTNSKTGQKFVL